MGKSKKLKALERRVLALEMLTGVVDDVSVTHDDSDSVESVTLGMWGHESVGVWYRSPLGASVAEAIGTVVISGVMYRAWVFSDVDDSEGKTIGVFNSRHEAMLAADKRLRDDGHVLPDTVAVAEDGLEYSDSRRRIAWVDLSPMSTPVFPNEWSGTYGSASSITEALTLLDKRDVDTAIARAKLDESEAEPEPPAKPLAGVTFTGEWKVDRRGLVVSVAVVLGWTGRSVQHCPAVIEEPEGVGAYWFVDDSTGHPFSPGVGTRADALAKAVEMGAEVRS